MSTIQVWSFTILLYCDFENVGVRIKKLELNNPNVELVRTLTRIDFEK